MRAVLSIISIALFSLAAEGAYAGPVYTTLMNPAFAEKGPGADGLLGTADDVARPGFNLSGSASVIAFSGTRIGNFLSAQTGTFSINQPLVAAGGQISISDFSISLTNEQSNGFSSTSVDVPSVLPHEVLFSFPGIFDANYTLLTTSPFGTLESDVSLPGFSIVPGVVPSLLPGIDAATASYLSFLKTIAPAGWTAISLGIGLPTAMTVINTRGTLSPLFIGGTASGVSVLVTTDPLNLVPEPAARLLQMTALLALGLLRRLRIGWGCGR